MRTATIAALTLTIGLLAGGCGEEGGPSPTSPAAGADDGKADNGAAASSRTTYMNMQDYLDATGGGGLYEVADTLRQNFDNICGDTFCGGDYGNMQSLAFTCSVTAKTGTVRHCLWIFAGSYQEIVPSTGVIHVNQKVFQCVIPVKGTTKQFLDAMTATDPNGQNALQRPLPGSTQSIYDALGNCL